LLGASVRLDGKMRLRTHLDEPAVERPPPEWIDDVLPPEPEPEDPARVARPLHVGHHHVEGLLIQTRHEPIGPARGLFGGIDPEIQVEAEARDGVQSRGARLAVPTEVPDAQRECLRVALTVDGSAAEGARHLIELCGERRVDGRIVGPRGRSGEGGTEQDRRPAKADPATPPSQS
jgi:hypothetical protein